MKSVQASKTIQRTENLSFNSVLKQSFEAYKKYFLVFFVLFVVIFGIRFIELKSSVSIKKSESVLLSRFFQILFFLLTSYLTTIFMKAGLAATLNTEKIKTKSLLVPAGFYIRKFLSDVIVNALILIGLFLLAIPSLFAYIRLQFAGYELLEKKVSVFFALRNSWNKTKGYALKILFIESILLIVNLLCLLFFVPGLLLIFPIYILAQSFIYRYLYNK
jgi:uncharacterized membrane protein